MPPVVTAITTFISSVTAAVSGALGAVGSWSGIAAFLTSPFGSLVLGVGLQLITSVLTKKSRGSGGQETKIEAARVNVRIAEPERWLCAGRLRQGGGVIFAEFDSQGNFWYVIAHCDSILTTEQYVFLDDDAVTKDQFGTVLDNQFSLTPEGDPYPGSGPRFAYFSHFSFTFTESNPIPTQFAALQTAFPGIWTNEHLLVGMTYSVVRIPPVAPEHRYKVFRWRGPVGIGEPAISILGNWSNVYDPRDPTQINGDATTYKYSRNPVLIWAWFRTHRYGRNKPRNSINWEKIAEQATICDQIVTDIDGNAAPRYTCDVAIPESTARTNGEQEILLACDAQLVFDGDGKVWPRVGYYYEPALSLVRNRDIVAMESVEARNGESLTQGVVVRYTDPDAKYSVTPSAPWVNPLYYVQGETPKYLVVDALAIQNHNQAMRLAKSVGMRSQPQYKLLPTVGLRGLKARQERIVNLNYDNDFAGPHEIVTPVEVDQTGAFCGFGCVPVDQDRWNLLPGEERSKPNVGSSNIPSLPTLPTGVVLDTNFNRINASFNPLSRPDWFVQFQFQFAQGPNPIANAWVDMIVIMANRYSYSGTTQANSDYFVRWRTVSTGGKVSPWVNPVAIVNTSTISLSGTPITNAQVGIAYSGFTISVTGGQAPYIYEDVYNRLPPGIGLNTSTGAISGQPTADGTYSAISIRVTDNLGNFRYFAEFTITVAPDGA